MEDLEKIFAIFKEDDCLAFLGAGAGSEELDILRQEERGGITVNIEKEDQTINEILYAALKDMDKYVRSAAAKALVKLGKTDSRVIDVLVQALKDEYSQMSSSAAQALGNLLQSTSDNQLIDMLQHNDSGYRKAAALALVAKNKKNPLSKETLQKIDDFKTKAPRPWVRLAAWDAFYLLHEEKKGTIDE